MSLIDCPRYCAGVEHVSSVRVRLAFSHLGGEHRSLQEAQLQPVGRALPSAISSCPMWAGGP